MCGIGRWPLRAIALVASKGGTGKTTLAAHLAVEAEREGLSVALVDMDPQASLTDWFNARQAETPRLSPATTDTLAERLGVLSEAQVDLAVVDTPPGQRAALEAAVRATGLSLIPCQPSPVDIRAVAATVALVEAAHKPFAFVINRAIPRTTIAQETTLLLAQHGRIAPEPLRQRVDYAAAMTDGRTAPELAPTGQAARECAALWAYIATIIEKV